MLSNATAVGQAAIGKYERATAARGARVAAIEYEQISLGLHVLPGRPIASVAK